MNRGVIHSSKKFLICLLPIVAALSLLFCATAGAYIYDDFSSNGIDAAKWTVSDPYHLFSEPGDGQLYFSSIGAEPLPGGSLRSTASFGPGFFSLDFNGFFSSNSSPGGLGLGSFAAIGLGTRDTTYVRMLRGRVVSEDWGYFEANYFDGTDLHVWYVYADAVSGQLGLSYDGSVVHFFYNDGINGWQELIVTGPDTKNRTLTVTPDWTSPPPMFVSGTPGSTGETRFAVDKVEVIPVPEPATTILLVSGLIGLAGLRSRFKK